MCVSRSQKNTSVIMNIKHIVTFSLGTTLVNKYVLVYPTSVTFIPSFKPK